MIFFVTSTTALKEWVRNLRDGHHVVEMVQTGGERTGSGSPIERNSQSFLDDTDSGSDVELRRMAEAPGKRSVSM